MTVVIGVDPGQTGGVAILETHSKVPWVYPMPALTDFVRLVHVWRGAHYFIEKAQSMPKQGIASAFSYGQHFGELLGVITAIGQPHTLVPPRVWSRVMHAGTDSGLDTKGRSVEAVMRLFPDVSLVPEGSKAKKPHLGIVEALLIGEYGRRQLNGAA